MNSEYDYVYTVSRKHSINIKKINNWFEKNPNIKVLIQVPNTLYLDIKTLNELNPNVKIRIAGAYDNERLKIYKNNTFYNSKKTRASTCKEYYYDSVIYTRNETIRIMQAIAKIEKGMNSKWTDIKKLLYLYTTLKRSIMYDPKYEEKPHKDIRTLRGLITHETVCAGYALILKELLDRQKIKSYYVKGKAHAWNIVEIEGKLYPIDLTHENAKYRSGLDNTFTYFGHNIKSFNAYHIPDKKEPFNNYQDKLHEFDPNLVEIIYRKIYKEFDYKTTTYLSERDNGEKFILSQLGTKTIGKEIYYKYYYLEISNNRVLSRYPYILYSKENVCSHMDKVRFTNNNYSAEESALIDNLFSRENIKDSLSKNTAYIGNFIIHNGMRYIEKQSKDCARCATPPKVFERSDKTMFVLEDNGQFFVEDMKVYKYNLYQIFSENGKPYLKCNIIYSEKDLLYDDREIFRDVYLSSQRINLKTKENSGYVGTIDEKGSISMNQKLVNYFKPENKNTIKGYKKYIDNHIHIPTFTEAEELYDRYRNRFVYASNCEEAEVENIDTDSIEKNKVKSAMAYFANLWADAAGELAFSEGIDQIYSFICKRLKDDIRIKGCIDTVDLYNSFNDNEYAQKIVVNLFNTIDKTYYINDLFLKSYNGKLVTNKKPTVLYEEEIEQRKKEYHN